MLQREDARAGVSKFAMVSLVVGIFFTLLAGFMIAGAAFGFGIVILPFFPYFFTLDLTVFLAIGIIGLIVAYRTW